MGMERFEHGPGPFRRRIASTGNALGILKVQKNSPSAILQTSRFLQMPRVTSNRGPVEFQTGYGAGIVITVWSRAMVPEKAKARPFSVAPVANVID